MRIDQNSHFISRSFPNLFDKKYFNKRLKYYIEIGTYYSIHLRTTLKYSIKINFDDVIILQYPKHFIRGKLDVDISPLRLFSDKSGY